jgi:hypothetical protein
MIDLVPFPTIDLMFSVTLLKLIESDKAALGQEVEGFHVVSGI